MYMPLCRECHRRESRYHHGESFIGDPTIIDASLENEAAEKKGLIKGSPHDSDTSGSLFEINDASATKSFSDECDGAEDL